MPILALNLLPFQDSTMPPSDPMPLNALNLLAEKETLAFMLKTQ